MAVEETSLRALDFKEGVPTDAYKRIQVGVELVDDDGAQAGSAHCLSYAVVSRAGHHIPPTTDYLNIVVSGACEKGLPSGYVQCLQTVQVKES